MCARDIEASAGEGARVSGGTAAHTRRMCTPRKGEDRESDGVLFTRRVAETRRPIDLHERPIKVVSCTSANGRERNVYSLESYVLFSPSGEALPSEGNLKGARKRNVTNIIASCNRTLIEANYGQDLERKVVILE